MRLILLKKNSRTASTVLNPISNMINMKWELRGAEFLSVKKSVIMVANHQSSLDILGMFAIWHTMGKVTVIAKREILYSGPFGLAAWLCGLVFINKKDVTESRELMRVAMEKLKRENIKLWVFPEGTRRNTGEIHEFKKGAFHLAIQTNTPIMPIVYSSYQTFLNDKEKVFNPGEVIIEALPEISTENYTTENVDELMEKTRKMMDITFHKNSLEIKNRQRQRKV
ncbi:1-acyl-sn-glycerol-3-phosphate acyltransferase alpha-like [Chironomus tepperi]|uniref:1-acyl-sn-glycerol-3-phosphate acyltransferase alpha-like n=1 Tax=Chironomus tepperi TaxID=113505 RepID=UPI00391F1BBE